MPDLAYVVPATFFFIISGIARSSVHVGFLDRPLAVGFLWGLYSGDMTTPVLLGLCCELFWLDLFPIGGYLPPIALFPLLLLLPLSAHFDWATPQSLALPLFLLFPLAYVPTFLERWLRLKAVHGHTLLSGQTANVLPLGGLPGKIIAGALLRQSLYEAGLFVLSLAAATLVFTLVRPLLDAAGRFMNISWPLLFCVCAIGAFLALRLPRVYLIFFVAMSVTGITLMV